MIDMLKKIYFYKKVKKMKNIEKNILKKILIIKRLNELKQ